MTRPSCSSPRSRGAARLTALRLNSPRLAAAAGLALALVTTPARADVITVDDDGQADFADLQAAVDAAQEGDLILIAEGFYPEAMIAGKGVLLAGWRGAAVHVEHVQVSDLQAGQRVALLGLELGFAHLVPPTSNWDAALDVRDCAGSVVWSGVDTTNRYYPGFVLPGVSIRGGVRIRNCTDVVLREGAIRGTGTTSLASVGTVSGVDVQDSQVALYRVQALGSSTGSSGHSGTCNTTNGSGVEAVQSFLHLGSSMTWGGSLGYDDNCDVPLDGGFGIWAAGSTIWTENTEVQGGVGGYSSCGFGGIDGCSGTPLHAIGSTVTTLEPTAPGIRASHLLAAGASHRFQFEASPGSRLWLIRGEQPVFQPRAPLGGVAHLVPDAVGWVDLGIVPESGRVDRVFEVPALQPGEGHRTVHLQTVAESPNGSLHLGEPHLAVLVEPPAGLPLRRVHVRTDAPPGGDGGSWATAFRSLHQAIESVNRQPWSSGEVEVWLGPGPHVTTDPLQPNVELPLELRTGIQLVGGFLGTETAKEQRPASTLSTIASGEADTWPPPSFDFFRAVGSQGRIGFERVEWLFRNSAKATASGTFDFAFEDCVLRSEGGGELDLRMFPTLYFPGYTLTSDTPPALEFGSLTSLLRSRVEGLTWNQTYGHTRMETCSFANAIEPDGSTGARPVIRVAGSSGPEPTVLLNNCLVTNLAAGPGGGAGFLSLPGPASVELVGCTLAHWEPELFFPLMNFDSIYGARLTISNCILWDIGLPPGQSFADSLWTMLLNTQVEHSCVEGLTDDLPGSGNFDADPRFLDPLGPDGLPGTGDEDFRLAPDSPCIDAGNNDLLPPDLLDLDGDGDVDEPVSLDLGGLPRQHDVASVPDTGVGPAPVVDIGAHESQD